ncbi:MAG: hypothetical protein ACK5NK_03865 [Niabella sp.]
MSKVLSNIYNIVVLVAFLYSLYLAIKEKSAAKQYYFFIYLMAVVIADIILPNISKLLKIHSNTSLMVFMYFAILYFSYFTYFNVKNKKIRYIIIAATIIAVIACLYFSLNNIGNQFPLGTLLSFPILYILLGLLWFYDTLQFVSEEKITRKMAFWVHAAQLIWAAFFIFRAVPMYVLNNADPSFFKLIYNIFSFVNIFTFLLYIKGLNCTKLSHNDPSTAI